MKKLRHIICDVCRVITDSDGEIAYTRKNKRGATMHFCSDRCWERDVKPKDFPPDKCPDCNDVGWYAAGSNASGWEQVQCQFCYVNPNSIFNRKKDEGN